MFVEKIVDETLFFSLGEQWEGLLDRCSFKTVFLSWQWQKTWWQGFHGDRSLYVLLIKDKADRARGLAPFYLDRRSSGKSILRVIGDNDISDYLSIMAEGGLEKEVFDALVGYLANEAGQWDEILIGPVKNESQAYAYLPANAAKYGFHVEITASETSPSVRLPQTWEAYLESLGPKERHELRRKLRKAAREAPLSYYICDDFAALDADMNSFLTLMEKSSPEKAAFLGENMRGFFKKVAGELFKAGWLDLSFLEVEGVRVAGNLCFDFCGSIQLYNSGFDPSYRALSGGIVLAADNIKRAIEKGRERFDFLRGSESYKYKFGAKDEPLFAISIRRK